MKVWIGFFDIEVFMNKKKLSEVEVFVANLDRENLLRQFRILYVALSAKIFQTISPEIISTREDVLSIVARYFKIKEKDLDQVIKGEQHLDRNKYIHSLTEEWNIFISRRGKLSREKTFKEFFFVFYLDKDSQHSFKRAKVKSIKAFLSAFYKLFIDNSADAAALQSFVALLSDDCVEELKQVYRTLTQPLDPLHFGDSEESPKDTNKISRRELGNTIEEAAIAHKKLTMLSEQEARERNGHHASEKESPYSRQNAIASHDLDPTSCPQTVALKNFYYEQGLSKTMTFNSNDVLVYIAFRLLRDPTTIINEIQAGRLSASDLIAEYKASLK